MQEARETQAGVRQTPLKELYSQTFYRNTNTLIVSYCSLKLVREREREKGREGEMELLSL